MTDETFDTVPEETAVLDTPIVGETPESTPEEGGIKTDPEEGQVTSSRADRYRAITGLDADEVSEYDVRRTLGED